MTTTAQHKDTHFNEPIDKSKPLSGYGRHGWEVPPEVQQKVIDIIIEEAGKLGFNKRDVAYYIAIAKRESQFNPDAANEGGTASGVAQVTNDTGDTYKVNDKNRFDARSSVKAGLEYFRDLKEKTIKDYGAASEKYEPLVYYRYHYGEFSTHRRETNAKGKVVVKEALPFSQLDGNKRYEDSKEVVQEAMRIEKILNDTHGLKIQLADVLGKPMAGRKGIVVQKIAKPAPAPAPAPATATPTATEKSKPVSSANSLSETNDVNNGTPVPESERTPTVQPIGACEIDQVHVTWELVAYEVTTDSEGNFPEVNSESQEPFILLIPRFEYDSYNAAVASGEIPEDGNQHELFCRNEATSVLPVTKVPVNAVEQKVDATPAPTPKNKAPQPKAAPVNIFEASEKSTKQGPPAPPSPDPTISFNDVVSAVKKDLGWSNVYTTSFAYAKQFFTRPKLPDKPLDENTPTQKSAARTQSVGSSLKNQDTKTLKVKDKVTTAEQPAVKAVEVVGDAPWMVKAIEEQTTTTKILKDEKRIKLEKENQQKNDPAWRAEEKVRDAAEKSIKNTKAYLFQEKNKSEKSRNLIKINEFEKKLKEQSAIADEADKKILEIEKKYNDEHIVKYLQSTSLGRDKARDDNTAWCSSFANWCLENGSSYRGTGSAAADSWLNWGEEISEPRYGAITIVTRENSPNVLYHVGFFLRLDKKNIKIGEEEIEKVGKNGNTTKVKQKKYKSVDVAHILSGNYSDKITEASDWTVNANDDPRRHLVSYRWPTSKEKKK